MSSVTNNNKNVQKTKCMQYNSGEKQAYVTVKNNT